MGRVLAAIVGARRAVAMSAMIAMRRRLKGVAMARVPRSNALVAKSCRRRVQADLSARGGSAMCRRLGAVRCVDV